jgi:hypothetical protein
VIALAKFSDKLPLDVVHERKRLEQFGVSLLKLFLRGDITD